MNAGAAVARLLDRLLYSPAPRLVTVVVLLILVGQAAPYLQATVRPDPDPITRAAPPVIATVAPLADAPSATPADGGYAGMAQACLQPVLRNGASVDLCWQAYRQLMDQDPDRDTYVLEIGATAHGRGAGMRWAIVEARVSSGTAADSSGSSSLGPGACTTIVANAGDSLPASQFVPATRFVLACEHWVMEEILEAPAPRRVRTDWDCVGCLWPVMGDRDVSLVEQVSVPQGQLPTWQIGADVGN